MKSIILCATPSGRAVVYGRVESDPVPGEPVKLYDARMILRWDAECGGLFGLAASGPKGDTRITASIPETVATEWAQYLAVTDEAAKKIAAWEAV